MTTKSFLKLYTALFISVSFGVVISFTLPLGIRIYPYDIPVLFLVPFSIMYLAQKKQILTTNIYLLFFLMIGFLGLFFSLSTVRDLLFSLGYLARVVMYLVLAIPIFSFNRSNILFILRITFIACLLFAGLGYVQYFLYPDLANLFYFGWDRHLYRFFSTFLDPNFAGAYLVFSYITTIGMLQLFWGKDMKRNTLLLSIIFLPAIFLTYSRTAYIMLITSMSFFLFFVNRKLLIFSFLVFLIILILLPKNFGGEGVNLLRTSSIISRIEANEFALSVFVQNPIIGVGFNGLRYAYIKDGSLSLENRASHSASGVPNSYVYILATTGVVGFGILSIYIFQVCKTLMNGVKIKTDSIIFKISVVAGLLGIFVASLFENVLFYSPIFICLVIFVSCSIRLGELEKKN